MYLLFVDESGTHGGSPVFVLGGLAIHENDAAQMQRALDTLVIKVLGHAPLNLEEYELHASEMRNAKKPRETLAGSSSVSSIWAKIPRPTRQKLLDEAYALIASFEPSNAELPVTLFGVAVDVRFKSDETQLSRERFAYEVLLNKFDVFLKNLRVKRDLPNRGLVIHDRRVVAEQDIQSWTAGWRQAAGSVGQLRNLADVPLFADSRASRLLQVADLISHGIFRRYAGGSPDSQRAFETIWPKFNAAQGHTHGCVHFTPSFGAGSCECEPCSERLRAEALDLAAAKPRKRVRRRLNRSTPAPGGFPE